MMAAIGNSYFSLSFFHLLTHAFFKALLFLAAGGVIHAMQGEQDLRRLAGGLSTFGKETLPGFLQSAFFIGTLSLVGMTFFSGYYSKEALLFSLTSSANTPVGLFGCFVLISSVFFTSYYSFRLFFLLFFAPVRSTTTYYQKNSTLRLDNSLILSLSILMVLSLISGFALKSTVISSTLLSNVLYPSSTSVLDLEFLC